MIAIHTRYLSATNSKSARIKAYTSDGRSVTVPVDYSLSDHMRHFHAVQMLILEKMPYAPPISNMVFGDSADGKGYVFCFGESKVFYKSEVEYA